MQWLGFHSHLTTNAGVYPVTFPRSEGPGTEELDQTVEGAQKP